jgi:small subunit ribosomal protein S6
MNKYETIMILNSDIKEEENQKTVEKIKDLINKNGEVLETEIWGTRKLAYPIRKHNTGYYVLINFKAEPDFIEELNRNYNIEENIIRHIIFKTEN